MINFGVQAIALKTTLWSLSGNRVSTTDFPSSSYFGGSKKQDGKMAESEGGREAHPSRIALQNWDRSFLLCEMDVSGFCSRTRDPVPRATS